MKETYEYTITDANTGSFNLKCRVEYNRENDYDTNYYFFDNNTWIKDFIDLNKLSPENKEDEVLFEDFITRVHDYMVHGNIWDEIKKIEDNGNLLKEQYKINITAEKL